MSWLYKIDFMILMVTIILCVMTNKKGQKIMLLPFGLISWWRKGIHYIYVYIEWNVGHIQDMNRTILITNPSQESFFLNGHRGERIPTWMHCIKVGQKPVHQWLQGSWQTTYYKQQARGTTGSKQEEAKSTKNLRLIIMFLYLLSPIPLFIWTTSWNKCSSISNYEPSKDQSPIYLWFWTKRLHWSIERP